MRASASQCHPGNREDFDRVWGQWGARSHSEKEQRGNFVAWGVGNGKTVRGVAIAPSQMIKNCTD